MESAFTLLAVVHEAYVHQVHCKGELERPVQRYRVVLQKVTQTLLCTIHRVDGFVVGLCTHTDQLVEVLVYQAP